MKYADVYEMIGPEEKDICGMGEERGEPAPLDVFQTKTLSMGIRCGCETRRYPASALGLRRTQMYNCLIHFLST